MSDDLKDWSKVNLGKQSRDAVTKTDQFNKSTSINIITRVQEEHMAKAKQSGNRDKVKDADRFCMALEREKSFLRYSK